MLHELVSIWFGWVEHWGYWGIFFLMALESSIIPVPAEIVIPPAAFWAAQGRMDFWAVIAIGTLGGYVGSVANYWLAQKIGLPVLKRYGRYVFLPEKKLDLASEWVEDYGAPGIFSARLLPVVRHLISIPAGVLRMPLLPFSVATVLGAGLWCSILAWFGREVLGGDPQLLQSPEALARAIHAKLEWIVIGVLILSALYVFVTLRASRIKAKKGKRAARASALRTQRSGN